MSGSLSKRRNKLFRWICYWIIKRSLFRNVFFSSSFLNFSIWQWRRPTLPSPATVLPLISLFNVFMHALKIGHHLRRSRFRHQSTLAIAKKTQIHIHSHTHTAHTHDGRMDGWTDAARLVRCRIEMRMLFFNLFHFDNFIHRRPSVSSKFPKNVPLESGRCDCKYGLMNIYGLISALTFRKR